MTIYHIFGFDTTRGGVCFLKEESEAQYMHKKNGKIVKRDILMTVTRRVIGGCDVYTYVGTWEKVKSMKRRGDDVYVYFRYEM